jgi:hypothetical protein
MHTRYSVSIFVAAPGTPLKGGGASAAGHVYYAVSDGSAQDSYGFAPAAHGAASGPGKVYRTDLDDYQAPFYTRTMEISKDQYDKLKDFGKYPDRHGFSTAYHGANNSCIDYTWGALNHAGLHRTNLFFQKDKDFEGALKPLSNEGAIQSIKAPFPDSELNNVVRNRMPERSLLQRIISDEQPQSRNGLDDPLLAQARDAMQRLEKGLGREYDANSERMAASAACLAKGSGLGRVDHVVLSQATATACQGETVFVVQGELGDPAHRRAHMPTAEAVRTPVETSVQRMQQADQTALAQNPQQAQNDALVQEAQQRGRSMG